MVAGNALNGMDLPLPDTAGPFAPRRAIAVRHEGPKRRPARRSLRQDRRLIAEVAAHLGMSLDLGSILLASMRLVHERFWYGNVAMFLIDASRRWLELRASYGDMVDPVAHASYRQAVEIGLVGEAFRTERLV